MCLPSVLECNLKFGKYQLKVQFSNEFFPTVPGGEGIEFSPPPPLSSWLRFNIFNCPPPHTAVRIQSHLLEPDPNQLTPLPVIIKATFWSSTTVNLNGTVSQNSMVFYHLSCCTCIGPTQWTAYWFYILLILYPHCGGILLHSMWHFIVRHWESTYIYIQCSSSLYREFCANLVRFLRTPVRA